MKTFQGAGSRLQVIILIFVMTIMLAACATLNLGEQATNDEEARAYVSDVVDSIDVGLTGAQTYIAIHPEKRAQYQAQILPLLSMSCDMTTDAIGYAKTGGQINGPMLAMNVSKYVLQTTAIIASWKMQEPVKKAAVRALLPTWEQIEQKLALVKQRIAADQAVSNAATRR